MADDDDGLREDLRCIRATLETIQAAVAPDTRLITHSVGRTTGTRNYSRRVPPATLAEPVRVYGNESARRGLFIFHENTVTATAVLFVGLDIPGVGSVFYTVKVLAEKVYELPGPPFFGGEVWIAFSDTNSVAHCTELV